MLSSSNISLTLAIKITGIMILWKKNHWSNYTYFVFTPDIFDNIHFDKILDTTQKSIQSFFSHLFHVIVNTCHIDDDNIPFSSEYVDK
jgi:hypothetical protein